MEGQDTQAEYESNYIEIGGSLINVAPMSGGGQGGSGGGNKQDKGKRRQGAWPIKNKWNNKFIEQFGEQLNNKLKELNNSDENFTCDDLALQLIISFAAQNNLPFSWTTESGTYDASDPQYSSQNDFLQDVKTHSGAPDFANNANTTQIPLSAVNVGSLNVLTGNGNSSPNHIQIISSVFSDGKSVIDNSYQGVTGFIAAQGNLRGGIFGYRLFGSGNPKAWNYLGTHLQTGIYDVSSNTWISPQKGITSNFLGGHYSNQYRNFNYMNWNH
jgi:hypothetical protein